MIGSGKRRYINDLPAVGIYPKHFGAELLLG